MDKESNKTFLIKAVIYSAILSIFLYGFVDTYSTSQKVIGAICLDGWHSSSTGRGTCSHHLGVSEWLFKEVPDNTPIYKKLLITATISWCIVTFLRSLLWFFWGELKSYLNKKS